MAAQNPNYKSIVLTPDQKNKIIIYWSNFEKSGFKVQDLKETVYEASGFDQMRRESIIVIKNMIEKYLCGQDNLKNFKSTLDGYNKRHNYWGFAAMKGQMFFNQLWNVSQSNVEKLDDILKNVISQPKNIEEALSKIDVLENYINQINLTVEDRRKAPKNGSVGYFLSYFWQIEDSAKYPIFYTSLTDKLDELGIWQEFDKQADAYNYFFCVMNEIKLFLEKHTNKNLHHWDVEHCFWKDNTDAGTVSPARTEKLLQSKPLKLVESTNIVSNSRSHLIDDYIPPIVKDLIESGWLKGDTKATKGVSYERKVGTTFRMLDFDVNQLGQGKGREPDGVITCRQDNTAFIFDAKVRENGYSIGVDDRAIKEYIETHYSILEKQGYKRVGFLVLSSQFNGNPSEIIKELTLDTPIKRVALVTSEALLHLLAYKLSSGVSTSEISKFLLQDGILTANDVDEAFADV